MEDFLDSSLSFTKLESLFKASVDSFNEGQHQLNTINVLTTEGFGLSDIWEQLQLINNPLLPRLVKACKDTADIKAVLLEDKRRSDSEDEGNESFSEEGDMSDYNLSEEEEVEQEMEQEIDTNSDDDNEDEVKEREIVKDQFFDQLQMEEFLKCGDRINTNREGDDDDGIDLFNSDAGEEEEWEEEREDQEEHYQYYNDFFDPPPVTTTNEGISSEEEEEEEEEEQLNLPLSIHQKRQQKMKSYIADLESANISDKPWTMTGEVASTGRGENTLLEEDLQFEGASRPAPEITDELTISLEDIIKQRIHDKTWDDVLRKTKPKERPFNYKVLQPLNDEKSKLSLAEVYEEEYIKQTQEERKQENPKHKEISILLKRLFAQLDALSNYHFIPSIVEPEVKTVSMVPSLKMEEVTPLTHTEATLRAPEEQEAPSHRAPLGTTERSSTDKLRERRKKKKLQHFKGPLKTKKDILKAVKQRATKDTVKSSGQFFAKLEREVKEGIATKRARHRQSEKSVSNVSSKLKL